MPGIDQVAPLVASAAAIEAQLRRFFPAGQFAFAFVPEQADAVVWRELTRRTPFIGLAWNGIAPDRQSGRDLAGACNWSLMLVTKHSEMTRRYLGDSTTPALLNMVWVACLALHGHALRTPDGLPLGTIGVTSAGNAAAAGWGEGQMGLATVEFATPLPTPGDAYTGAIPDFLELGVTWDFPGLGAVTDNYERPA